MQANAIAAAADMTADFDSSAYAHTDTIANLVHKRLPNGELAWRKPCTETFEPDDALYTITDAGRRALRRAELFGAAPDDD
jgi:hypothetical protein